MPAINLTPRTTTTTTTATTAAANMPSGNSKLPYQISIGLTGGLLLVTILLLAYTYHRLRLAMHNNSVLAQLGHRLKDCLRERDAEIGDLEMFIRSIKGGLDEVFVIGEEEEEDDDDDDDGHHRQENKVKEEQEDRDKFEYGPTPRPEEARTARVVAPRTTYLTRKAGHDESTTAVGGTAQASKESAPATGTAA
ncbi:hypothetical protein ACRE_074230 [Hapsidospora chrysogenum ATCC 11550]|uniref:Uncharacterized protein n=1 Tax=Hapsidospora chrysogenum (strain ATCC 11550 / CBS 779.69 / DSM 880 / IAM 14645 / JCM 23072 / IMI 49137) TaxID=857340 RepID=A0A086SXM4_HAPC1|nr:hypothetical protein ACRE_074230 [Hapsidospora chrysogenum ATCC 11550]